MEQWSREIRAGLRVSEIAVCTGSGGGTLGGRRVSSGTDSEENRSSYGGWRWLGESEWSEESEGEGGRVMGPRMMVVEVRPRE